MPRLQIGDPSAKHTGFTKAITKLLPSELNLAEPNQVRFFIPSGRAANALSYGCLLWSPTRHRHTAIRKPTAQGISSYRNNTVTTSSSYLQQSTCTSGRQCLASKDKQFPWLFPDNTLPCWDARQDSHQEEKILVPSWEWFWVNHLQHFQLGWESGQCREEEKLENLCYAFEEMQKLGLQPGE